MGGLMSKGRKNLKTLQDLFNNLEKSDSNSLVKKYLTREMFEKLKTSKTSLGVTLLDVARSGLVNLDSGVGIYIPDVESLTVFAELFDPVIENYHQGFATTDVHPPKSWGNFDAIGDVDPEGKYVVSTRVRVGRSVEGYLLNPRMTQKDYLDIEKKVIEVLGRLTDELSGEYLSLEKMNKETQQELIDSHLLFKEGDRFLIEANSCRFWPKGRGIFLNKDRTFLVWCNEEDHLRIISMQPGGNLGQVYRRLATAVDIIEKTIPFSHHPRLGYVTFCPTNLGTGLRASVHVRLPKLASNRAQLEAIAEKHELQVRGTRGEHTEAEGGIYDVSNKRRLGITEFQAIKIMYEGVMALINAEKALEKQ